MVEGSVQQFLERVTLLGQPFVKDDKQTVEKMLDGQEGEGQRLSRFFVVGEGIEKKRATSPPKSMAQAEMAQETRQNDA